jgi:hypothetical protein
MRISIIIVLGLLFSCANTDFPRDIIPPARIRPIIFDLLKADEYLNNFILKDTLLKRDKEAVKLYEQVFQIHKTNSSEFYKSYRYYQAHPDKNKALMDSLNALVTRQSNIRDSTSIKPK